MMLSTISATNDAFTIRLTGKERDSESGNDYFGARYYASSMGRWMSPDWSAKEDPVPYAKLDDPQSLNLYSYVRNNPLSQTDADGHCFPWCAPAFAGGAALLGEEAPLAAAGPVGWAIIGATAVGVAAVATYEVMHNDNPAPEPAAAPAPTSTETAAPSTTSTAPLPANPDDLKSQGYTETSHPEAAAAGHRTFENPQTGDKVGHDAAKEGASGHEGTNHYHRYNPNATGKKDQYLDKDGKPVARGSDDSHLQPKPTPPPTPQSQPQS